MWYEKDITYWNGGTIACGHSEDGLKPLLTPEQLLSYVQDSKEFCETDTIQLMNLDSTNIEQSIGLLWQPALKHIMTSMMVLSFVMERTRWHLRRQHSLI